LDRRRLQFVLFLSALTACVGPLACDDEAGFRPLPGPDMRPLDAFVRPDAEVVDMRTAPTDDFGDPCTENADCRSNFCVAIDDARVCSRRCGGEEDCPDDWFCAQVTNPGADVTFICVPSTAPCAGADLMTDSDHCGACDDACAFAAAEATCVDGECALGPCIAGAVDLDGDSTNGCEYACTVTRAGEEACDAIDNDCDGATDEGIDTATDPAHCGECGARCALANADPICVDGACQIAACADGFIDIDQDAANGCEFGCDVSNGGVEACDVIDNDCDGAVDEGVDLQTNAIHCGACNMPCSLANATAICAAGACVFEACLPDFYDRNDDPLDGCEVGCQPSNDGIERCDAVDNDCDAAVDEGFDLQADVLHCGACGVPCARPNAMRACADGACRDLACVDGFHDLDGDPANGCEYACEPAGAEACNRVDDDCDGGVDEGFDVQSDVAHCGGCGLTCAPDNAVAECAAGMCAIDACDDAFADLDAEPANGCECSIEPEACDAADNDCDGRVDEDFDLQGSVAHCGGCGRTCMPPNSAGLCAGGDCRVDRCDGGWRDLDRAVANGCECRVEFETCNAADDDCDGRIDEDYDFDFDVNHCGGCDQRCDPPNAVALCVGRQCRVDECLPGFVDDDGDAANGCELDCEGVDAMDPACGGGGPMITYAGDYIFAPSFRYSCFSVFGDQVLSVNTNALSFAIQGDALIIDGLNAPMRMSPAPDGPEFSAQGVIAGDCQETYILDASYIDADTWRGTIQLQFSGFTCGFTDCQNVSFRVEGERQ
jgi:hypothetical protein